MAPDEISIILQKLAAIEATLSERCATRGSVIEEMREDIANNKAKISRMEKDQAKMMGFAAAIGAVAAYIGQAIIKLYPFSK